MVEATPGHPYGEITSTLLCNFQHIQKNMELRRKEAQSLLNEDEHLLSLTSFPRLVSH